MPPDRIRLKLIEFERQDACYAFGEMKASLTTDEDVGAWWVYWVFQTCFVWRFLFGKDNSEDGKWLHKTFKETVGERLYDKKIADTLAYLKSVDETVEENL